MRHSLDPDQTPAPMWCAKLGHVSASGEPVEVEADLQWAPGSTVVFSGTMALDGPAVLKVFFV